MLELSNKSSTLLLLENRLEHAVVSCQVRFNYKQWKDQKKHWLEKIKETFDGGKIIVRSSHSSEDKSSFSLAGHFPSSGIIDVGSTTAIVILTLQM